jgi:uncharacterized protein YycO
MTIIESILESVIGEFFFAIPKHLGVTIKWLFKRKIKSYSEILKENYNTRLGFLAIGLFTVIIYSGIYAKQKFYKYRLQNATNEVKVLTDNNEIQNGDLIFQTSLSAQSKAIQLATRSEYSHCGIIYKNGNDYYVYEAVQPVKETLLNKWIARGKDGHFVIKRLKNSDQVLTPAVLLKMKKIGNKFKGKDYDIYFEWSDDKIYCSELIWKIYKQATGLEIGKLEKLKDFDLSNDAVKVKMRERYGNNIPMEETVISPVEVFNSDLLMTVKSN